MVKMTSGNGLRGNPEAASVAKLVLGMSHWRGKRTIFEVLGPKM